MIGTATQGGLTRAQMEERRLKAVEMYRRHVRQSVIAQVLGVSRTSAGRWCRLLDHLGVGGLRTHPAPGRPCRMTEEQQADVVKLYEAGPRAAGIDRAFWTTGSLAQAVEQRLGVHYHGDHMGRIIRRLGLLQGPARKAKERAA